MTDEELAEEWIKEHSGLIGSYKFVKYDYDSLKQAFLEGLKAGSKLDKVWHDYDAGEDCYEDTHEGRWIKREAVNKELQSQLTEVKSLMREALSICKVEMSPFVREAHKNIFEEIEAFVKE